MRILLTTDTVGGVWDYATTLSSVLADEGHAVLLAILGDPSDEQLASLPEEIAIVARGFRLEWMPGAGDDVEVTARWLAKLARAWKSDLVHLNQMAYTGRVEFGAPTVVVAHSDVVSWLSEVKGEAAGAEWSEYIRSIRAGLRGADVVVAPSAYQAELVQRFYGATGVAVIHNGSASAVQHPTADRQGHIVAAGRAWDEAKDFATLDRALARLDGRAPEARLFGPLRSPHGVEFTPAVLECAGVARRDELDREMARSGVYVAPSRYEPFGLAPLEAARAGCALVLSRIGSFVELWDGCAEFFPAGDDHRLAEIIERLAGDPAHTLALAQAAQARALEAFAVERFARDYLDLYRRTVGGATTRPTLAPPLLER